MLEPTTRGAPTGHAVDVNVENNGENLEPAPPDQYLNAENEDQVTPVKKNIPQGDINQDIDEYSEVSGPTRSTISPLSGDLLENHEPG